MKSSYRQNSQFVQQLCRHINKLEQTNIRLHETIAQFQMEKNMVCQYLSFDSWESLVFQCQNPLKQNRIINNKENKGYFSRYQGYERQKTSESMKKTGLVFDSDQSETSSYQNSSYKTNLDSTKNSNKSRISIIDKLKNLDNQNNLTLNNLELKQFDKHSFSKTKKPYNYKPHKLTPQNIKQAELDGYQSPIESESRIVNRSIRGDTDRDYEDSSEKDTASFQQIFVQNKNSDSKQIDNMEQDYKYQHPHPQYIHIEDASDEEQELALLSIQNTKLRQKVNKLYAIIESKQICEKYYSQT